MFRTSWAASEKKAPSGWNEYDAIEREFLEAVSAEGPVFGERDA